MQALNDLFDKYVPEGVNNFLVKAEKLPNGSYQFSFEPLGVQARPLFFILTRYGLSPMDNRGIMG